MLTTHNIGSRREKPAQQNHKRSITIHLGTFKTATTYLQYILRHNYGTPSGEIYYPDVAIWGDAHHYLVQEFPPWESKRSDRQYAKSWQKLIEVIDRSDAANIIISSEMFCAFTEAEIQAVGEYLNDFSLRAIIYLRRQDQYFSSLMEQFIKGVHGGKHQYTCQDSTLETLTISSRHNYLDICTRWSRLIGKENMIVRPFERSQMIQGDILTDFFHCLFGIPPASDITFPEKNLNPRLCRDALEFKRLVNCLPFSRDDMNSTLPGLFEYSKSQDSTTQNSFHEHTLLLPAQRIAILEACAPRNQQVAREFLGKDDGVLFNEPVPDCDLEWEGYGGLTSRKVQDITEAIAGHSSSAILVLVEGILAAKKSEDAHARHAADILGPVLDFKVPYAVRSRRRLGRLKRKLKKFIQS